MTQTPQMGLPEATTPGPTRQSSMTRNRVVLVVVFAGAVSVAATLTWAAELPTPMHALAVQGIWPYLALVAAAMLAEVIYYPIRHGDSYEEQTFYEIVLLIATLLLTPGAALIVSLLGLVLAEIVLFRSAIKALFNVGSYAIATSALVVTYTLLVGDADRLSTRSILALLAATIVWQLINLALIGWILQVAENLPMREFVRAEVFLTFLVSVTAVGVAASVVALVPISPLLVPFMLLPAVALWYAYRTNAARVEAQERSQAIARLLSELTSAAPATQLLAHAADEVRRTFGADDALMVLDNLAFSGSNPGEPMAPKAATERERALISRVRHGTIEGVADLPRDLLPENWDNGYVTPLNFTGDGSGVLALGATAPPPGLRRLLPWAKGGRDLWRLKAGDRPVLASLASSISSTILASRRLDALREETAKLTAVVDHASDGIAVFDSSGDAVLWSPAMTTITGLGPDELADWPGAEVTATLAQLRGLSTGTEGRMVTITRSDGEERELNVAVVAIQDEGHLSVLTVRDVTLQRRLDRMKSDFIATAAHELRTPITPIKGYAQLLATRWDKMTPEKRANILGTIEERASHLSRLVDDLMLATRVSDSDKVFEVKVGSYDLTELVEKAVAGKTDLVDRLTVTGAPATVMCDPTRTLQCLDNLISNASKYSEAGTPITVHYGRIDDGMVLVDVTDQGRGIPSSEVGKVFEKFYRVEDPMTMTTGGQGLGLFLSREFARAMNGDVSVTSRLGHGSTFTLRLPLAVEAP